LGYVTISAKITIWLKELLDIYGNKPGPVTERALEEEVKKHLSTELEEDEKLRMKAKQYVETLKTNVLARNRP
jgi:hypothetical protein